MFGKAFAFVLLIIGVQSRVVYVSDLDLDEPTAIWAEAPEYQVDDSLYHGLRYRRHIGGSVNTNPDGSANVNVKIPIATSDSNRLSATAGVAGHQNNGNYKAASAGVALENINGHALSVSQKHIPNFGDQLTAAAKVNLLHNDKHNLDANAFITKNKPNIPNLPDFNTKGGSIDYTYNDKFGATLGMAKTDFLKRTDYSALGNLNLYRGRDTSLDFNAGYTKSISPYLPSTSWQPTAGFSFTKFFN